MVDVIDRAKEAPARFNKVLAFLKNAETKYPQLSLQLPNLLSRMLGNQSFDPNLMVRNEGYINGGFAFLGEWLSQTGFKGFEVAGLSLEDYVIKKAAPHKVSLPARDEFFANSGISKGDWAQLQAAMVDLSHTVGQALEVGYKPKQVLAALFIQSTAAIGKEQPETSIATREMLIKASGDRLTELNQILNRWVQGK